jgi:hypothetical protein
MSRVRGRLHNAFLVASLMYDKRYVACDIAAQQCDFPTRKKWYQCQDGLSYIKDATENAM